MSETKIDFGKKKFSEAISIKNNPQLFTKTQSQLNFISFFLSDIIFNDEYRQNKFN